ncbi:sensor histidine kinase [Salinibaculum salinum]|uniref:sensor histidine kinase n=1 Tax=Salinibaculum salinum TaxID=3131996 RepID=UPI0030ED94D7
MAGLDLEASVVVDAIDDALVVLNEAGDVLDCNEAFATLVAPDGGDDIDRIEAGLDGYPALREQLERGNEGIVPIETGDDICYYQLTISTIDGETGSDPTLAVLHDVTAQQRQQTKLEQQNEQLDRFASFITHDLRNPLDVAIGRTTAIAELVDDPQVEKHIEEIRASHTRLVRIIQDVLTLARQGQSIDKKSDVTLANTARNAWDHVETAHAVLDVQTEQTVRADRNRLEQIFENLFRNSVAHGSSSESGTVTVTVGTIADGGGFFVADDGPGIDEDVREKVLEPGFSDENGTGLGLAIVSNIAAAHGWDVTVTAAESGGAQFEFTGVDVAVDTCNNN